MVEGGQVTAVGWSPERDAAQEFARAGQFFPPPLPTVVRDRLIQQFKGTVERLLAALLVFSISTGCARHIVADIGQLFHK